MDHPALTVSGVDPDLVLAAADDFSPIAAASDDSSITVYFRESAARDAARAAIARAFPAAAIESREIDDGDWARRSQDNLTPITIGTITVLPASAFARRNALELRRDKPSPEPRALSQPLASSLCSIVIPPSMAFGTGHHPTTRMCLQGLQEEDLVGRHVLDVGTGSGVLAIAAVRLGAATAIGIDSDPDAIATARENLTLNPGAAGVTFVLADLGDAVNLPSRRFDVVLANLTGTLLTREAERLAAAVAPGGRLIVSGLLASEEPQVASAFGGELVWRARDEEWVALMIRPNVPG